VDRVKTPSLFIYLFLLFFPIILWKINLLYFIFPFFFRPLPFHINQMHPSALPICLFCFILFYFIFLTSCAFNDVKTKYLVYLLFPTFLFNIYDLLRKYCGCSISLELI